MNDAQVDAFLVHMGELIQTLTAQTDALTENSLILREVLASILSDEETGDEAANLLQFMDGSTMELINADRPARPQASGI